MIYDGCAIPRSAISRLLSYRDIVTLFTSIICRPENRSWVRFSNLGGGVRKRTFRQIDIRSLSQNLRFRAGTRPPEKRPSLFLKNPGKKRQQKGKPTDKFLAPTDKSLAPTDKYLTQRTSVFPPCKTFT